MDEKVEFAIKFIKDNIGKYNNIAVANSFGKDSMVAQSLVNRAGYGHLPVLWIKPPFLPKETLKFAEEVIKEWNLDVKILTSKMEEDEKRMRDMVYTPELWKSAPETCCHIFKVKPIKDAIKEFGFDAWFSGMRKTESEHRKQYTYTLKQGSFTKLHPILDFTEADVWRYTAANNLPVHPWYALGYRSLGCEMCSSPNIWDEERGGRWYNTSMICRECGIHELPMRDNNAK